MSGSLGKADYYHGPRTYQYIIGIGVACVVGEGTGAKTTNMALTDDGVWIASDFV